MTFADRTSTFVNWLKSSDVSVSPKITIADLRDRGQGRGVVALEDIEEGETIFTIPREKLLNLHNGSLYNESDESVREKLDILGPWESLILAILWEWKVKDESSTWKGYLDVLPLNDSTYTSNQLISWSDNELKLLQPSLILDRIGKEQAREMYDSLFPETVEDLGILKQLGEITYDDYHKVASVIMSYSFDVENEDNENQDEEEEEDDDDDEADSFVKCMVPLADTLNADTNLCNANLMYNPKALSMQATKKIPKGDQVYNTYSDHPNSEILRRYGYVEVGGSKNDFGEVKLENIKEAFSGLIPWLDELFDLIDDEISLSEIEEGVDILNDAYDCYISGEVNPEFMLLVQFLVVIGKVNEQEPIGEGEDRVKQSQRIFKKCVQLIESEKLTKGFLKFYTEILEKRLLEYECTNIDDKEIQPDQELSRAQMANVVRTSELRSLKKCFNVEDVFKSYSIIEDDKLLRNIFKKRNNEGTENARKKAKK